MAMASRAVQLIGLCGKAYSGKSAIAEIMLKCLNAELHSKEQAWEEKTFSFALKRSAETLLSLPINSADDRKKRMEMLPGLEMTLARFLQLYGQGMREKICLDVLERLLFANFSSSSHWVISDVRHVSEVLAIKKRGGIILKIDCSEEVREERCRTLSLANSQKDAAASTTDGRDAKHCSETEVDLIQGDYIVRNESTIEALEDTIRTLLFRLLVMGAR